MSDKNPQNVFNNFHYLTFKHTYELCRHLNLSAVYRKGNLEDHNTVLTLSKALNNKTEL